MMNKSDLDVCQEDIICAADYLIVVSNAYARPVCDVWPIGLRQPLPVLPIPLLRPDPDIPLDLEQALRTAYARARYDLRIDYTRPPSPPLLPARHSLGYGIAGASWYRVS